tara:strand:- start:1460 stop:1984 length:525 start_codon:yes stop_codon:yes gene_type:complete
MSTDKNTEEIEVASAETDAPAAKKKTARLTVLDQLKEEISKEVTRPDIEIPVPERKGVTVRFSPNITNEQLKSWRRNATNRKTEELDSIKFSCYVVGQTVSGIYFNDEIVLDDEGNEITFASPVIMEMTNTDRPLPDAIRAFYAVDPHLESVALKILDYAGYGDDIDAEDPTLG